MQKAETGTAMRPVRKKQMQGSAYTGGKINQKER